MEKRFEFVIGINDKQEDSTSFMYLTKKQMKAISLVLNMGVEVFKDEKGVEIEEVELIQFGTLDQREDDAFIDERFLSELMEVIEKLQNKIYQDDPNKEAEVEAYINACKKTLQELDEIP